MKPPVLTPEVLDRFSNKVRDRYPLTAFYLSLDSENVLKLDSFIVSKEARSSGVGSDVMRAVTRFADSYGLRVVLTPGLRDDRHGTTSRVRLVRFYKKFGFYENKGRRKDFSVSGGMIRDPGEPSYGVKNDDFGGLILR